MPPVLLTPGTDSGDRTAQSFCFDEQRLQAGEEVAMPVFFYLDPELLNDLNVKGIETVTLSYTFFSE